MLFNSLSFIIFFITTILVYYLIPQNGIRKVFLLFASYYFYACFNVVMLSILLFETIVAYCFGISKNKSKVVLFFTIFLLLLPLACFKYIDFFINILLDVVSLFHVTVSMTSFNLLLPIGISFYTFMAVGYVVDVFEKKVD